MHPSDCDRLANQSCRDRHGGALAEPPTAAPHRGHRRGSRERLLLQIREPVVGHDRAAGQASDPAHASRGGDNPAPAINRGGGDAYLSRNGLGGPKLPDFAQPPISPPHGGSLAFHAPINKPGAEIGERMTHPCGQRTGVVYSSMSKELDTSGQDAAEVAYRVEVGKRLRMVRKLIDDNRTRMAGRFKIEGKPVFHTTWRMWEQGTFLPNVRVMADFCDRYHVTMDWIYRGVFESLPEGLKLIMYKAHPELLEQQLSRKTSAAAPAARPPVPSPDEDEAEVFRTLAQGPARGRRRRGSLKQRTPQNGEV